MELVQVVPVFLQPDALPFVDVRALNANSWHWLQPRRSTDWYGPSLKTCEKLLHQEIDIIQKSHLADNAVGTVTFEV